MLVYVLTGILKLLHPFMPFITEEIYQALPHSCASIMISKWPEYDEKLCFAEAEAAFEKIMAVVRAVRNRRAEMNVPPSKKATLYIATADADTFAAGAVFMQRLAYASEVEIAAEFDLPDAVKVITPDAVVSVPLSELVDFAAETARLQKELDAAQKDADFFRSKLNNPGFVAKAPAPVVEKQRAQLARVEEKIKMLEESIEDLQAKM